MATCVGLKPSFVLPPIPHPHPYEHIAIIATDEGLAMRPYLTGPSHSLSYVRIPWGKHPNVQELQHDGNDSSIDWKSSVVIYGIVGIMELFNASYLLVITARSHVGCLFDEDHPIYSVKSVCAIPLFKDRAQHVLDTIAGHISPALPHLPNDGAQDLALAEESTSTRVKFADENNVKIMSPTARVDTASIQGEERLSSLPSSGTSTPTSSDSSTGPNIVKAIADRMSFWTRLSGRQSTLPHDSATGSDTHRSLDSIIQSAQGEPTAIIDTIIASTAPPPESVEERHTELEDRVVRECVREYVKGCMYFAYHFDITKSLQNKHDQFLKSRTEESLLAKLNALPPDPSTDHSDSKVDPLVEPFSTLPLWRRVTREFWWNEWLLKPFIDAGMHSYVLPIVQGHFQVSSFDLPKSSYMSEHDVVSRVDYLIASRRSRYRAGLRYQRRGVDEEAHVANFVETETIMRIERNGIANVFSFVQIRGSIPLYWTQSGYSIKPPPVLSPERTPEQSLDAMKRHFQHTVAIYGPHTIVNLTEQTGKEGVLTNAYKSHVQRIGNKDIRYCEWDFHHETRGMKYENISKLIDNLERTFQSQGYFWISDHMLLAKQKGVFRVNCIDCLDRTNVVQSAFARHVLGMQLEAVGLTIEPHNGRSGMDTAFNDVWANNGDAISRAYAGTSALKGDFTRTGKRDLGGLLSDGVNSLARMYSATFGDWFSQAIIDFMLGYRTDSVFSEFLLKLQSTDPQELIRLSRIRAEAIATSVSRVLDEGEPLLAGWTLIAPEHLNMKISDRFEEKVLLLSARALYIVRYDYTLEKVKLYTRVPLGMITRMTKGAYILSPLEEASRDPTQNAGFIVTWLNTDLVSSRMTSYSYRNCPVDVSKSDSAHVEVHDKMAPGSAKSVGNRLLGMVHTRATSKSATLGDRAGSKDTSCAAFKALPMGSTHVRNASRYAEPADDLASATSCKEAVDIIVGAIQRACEDIGSASGKHFIVEEDIVSVSEAQRTTSIYAKMEYGVKRLLWLGG
ncbi:SacI homology domain-containing protein [Boletus edulis BED1]|uniref:SacI homology domain-containing protein n=1 Tax=Boletus edulis BED1 TaxID=1328754 RepID=A0AAD4C3K7_BOLED|nr:SacI homology domain-containing protein [Boletus edulis BED1]